MAEDTDDERANIKCDSETFDRLTAEKRPGETWDGLLRRAATALEDGEPIREFSDAVVYTANGEKHEGRTELYENWVRVGGPIPAWIPRDEIDQLHES